MSRECRQIREDELDAVHEVEKKAWGDDLAASRETIEERYETFPDGYLGCFDDGKLKGFTFGIIYDYEKYQPKTWYDATDLNKHDESGDTLYIVSASVGYQRQGIGTELMEGNKQLADELGVDRIVLGSRMNTISFYEKCGFETMEHIEDWWSDDEESDGEGVVMQYRLD
jgi:GNAT superfamily N-acetyltransferase